MTILDDLHQIAPLAGGEAVRSPIVEDKKIAVAAAPPQ
jgi:hypothetical protein